ncbi:MAG: aspartate--tRNA ligase [Mycoplasmataceae bacterium]|nr:aspartate--tRNA ligase [Mycoplasmataceae bacterium]
MNNNFKLNIQNIGEKIELKGWVNKIRKLGELIFIDIRNGQEIIQAVIDSSSSSYEIANKLKNEFVIFVKGKIVKRKEENLKLVSGSIEILIHEIIIINKSKQTPMLIRDETDALEQKRNEYRYIDLRRKVNQEMLKSRSDFNKLIRDYFYNKNFIEVETPIITKPSSGGAGEFKIISEKHKGKYYSLAQSPQIYKQLLMYGGLNKYFQIARCFRDEDSRKDRQLEFTQLDLEMSFVTREEIMKIINDLLKKIVTKFTNYKFDKIPIITFEESISQYGSDKPDTRFENKISDLTSILKVTPVNFIYDKILSGKEVKAVFFEKNISNGEIKEIDKLIKSQGSSGLSWVKFSNNEILGSLKLLSKQNIEDIKTEMNIDTDGILLIIIDKKMKALEFIGRIRLLVAEKLNIINNDKFSFVWVVDFPLFKKNLEGKIESMHNPFTSIKEEYKDKFKSLTIDNKELVTILSNSYDIILNGYEIGGGSSRISNVEEQNKVFEFIGISQQEKDSSFGWFLEAQKYGIPEHGGIALGLDRILSILLKKDSIREVIAFPKSSHGTDEMMKSPIDLK